MLKDLYCWSYLESFNSAKLYVNIMISHSANFIFLHPSLLEVPLDSQPGLSKDLEVRLFTSRVASGWFDQVVIYLACWSCIR